MEKLETIEVINLELNEIQKAVTIMNGLRLSFLHMEDLAKELNDTVPEEQHLILTDQLEKVRNSLVNVVNNAWDYLNNCDGITDLDVALSELPMKIINSKNYER